MHPRTSVIKNFWYSLGGIAVPVAATVLTIPPYLRTLGEERYGVLSLIWLLFGYFGLFDFGLSRSTTNRLAQVGHTGLALRERVFVTSLIMNLGLGLVAALLFLTVGYPLLSRFLASSPGIDSEIHQVFPLVAIMFPAAMVGNVFVGRLQAEERFRVLNLVQVAGALAIQLLPLASIYLFGAHLVFAAAGVVAGRFATIFALGFVTRRSGKRESGARFDRHEAKKLLKYGGWVTITNAISPLLISLDQFLIGSLLGSAAVARYSIPFNLAQKALIIPGALTNALFPRMSSLGRHEAGYLARQALLVLGSIMALICAPATLLANVGLAVWLGPEFADQARGVAQTILFGVWINGIAFVPYCLLQGQGRVDLVARFHMLEFLPFIALLYVFVQMFGLIGAAYAWVLRVSVDAALLLGATTFRRAALQSLAPSGIAMLAAWGLATWLQPAPWLALGLAFAFFSLIGGGLLVRLSDIRAQAAALQT